MGETYMKQLNEVSRKNLVGKTKVYSPARYNKRLRYSTMSVPEIDGNALLHEDKLIIHVEVGKYIDTLAYEGVTERLIKIVKSDSRHAVTRRAVVRAMNEQVDLTDVYVRCSCPDWSHRFAYYASKFNYIYGPKEKRPSKITNPHDNLGATCKHLACILSNKKWLVKAASVVNDFIHDNYEEFISAYNINPDEFVINEQAYNAASIGAVKRELKQLPPDLLVVVNRLYSPESLEEDLYNNIGRRGWELRVDNDLDKPVAVYISKDLAALGDPESSKEPVYVFDVKPAGSKIRLVRVSE